MSEAIGPLVAEIIAELSRRPSLEQYVILQEENRLIREEVLRLRAERDGKGSFW